MIEPCSSFLIFRHGVDVVHHLFLQACDDLEEACAYSASTSASLAVKPLYQTSP